MVPIRESCRAAGPRAPQSSAVVWFATAVAVAVLVWLAVAVAAAKSGGLDRLLPKNVPYFTT